MSRTVATLFASIATVALVAGCGGSDGDASDNSAAPVASAVDGGSDTVTPNESAPEEGSSTTESSDAGSEPTEADFVDAFATSTALFDDDDDANQCVGQVFVDFIGLDQLVATGMSPDELTGSVLLDGAGLTVSADDLPMAIDELAGCGDLASVALESSSAPAEQTACAAEVVTNDLAAEQLLVQVFSLEPSAELATARDALQVCAAG